LRDEVEARLKLLWSPRQISAWLKREYSDNPQMQISHETIYISLYVQGRGALRKQLTQHLRTHRTYRRAKNEMRPATPRQIPNPILISQRPAEAADRAVPGHWEGDLLLGTPTTAIGTLVERSTRYVMLFSLPRAAIRAEAVRQALAATIVKLPVSLRRSLTWDQGSEMRSTNASLSTPGSRSTSATPAAHGSGAPTKTPTDCSASTFPKVTALPA